MTRQTDKQTNRQTNKETNKQTKNEWMNRIVAYTDTDKIITLEKSSEKKSSWNLDWNFILIITVFENFLTISVEENESLLRS